MPQMAPLNWLSLFLMFMTLFLLMSSINYYSFFYSTKKSFFKNILIKNNWKW